MTSKLVVNTIEADTGISSVSFGSSISLSSTSKFFFSDAGIDIGADTNINRPASGVLGFNINGGEKVRIKSNGFVGIGTDNPGVQLHVLSSSTGLKLQRGNEFFSVNANYGGQSHCALETTNALSIRTGSGAQNERLRITSNGYIGIGTDNPTENLDIISATNSQNLRIWSKGSSNNSTLFLRTGDSGGAFIKFGDNSDNDIGKIHYSNSTNSMRFTTNTEERLIIDSNGLVGIGTDTPYNPLEVAASSADIMIYDTQAYSQNSSGPALSLAGRDSAGVRKTFADVRGVANGANMGEFAIRTRRSGGTLTEGLRITNNGNLLIGSTNEANNIRLGNKIGIVGTASYTGMSITNYPGTNASHAPMFDFNRSRGTSDQSMTSVIASDKLGEIIFRGSNGSSFTDGVTLRAYADTVSSGNVNGRFEIGTTNGSHTAKMIVSKEGYITEPSNPKFWAKSNAAQTLNGNGTNYIKNYQDEVFDIGNCYDGTNKFTAPITGYYHFGWSFMMQGGNADGFTYVFGAPLISGNDIAQEVMSPRSGGANYVSVVGSHLLYLTSGQYVQIRMRQSGGNPVSIRSDQCYFWGYLVG